ncbi:hypothetical protein SERLADRAFT_412027 [Serpula lacrymans var. lacrymans S7.9]|uniref:Uncharacterized protein n=1 Tax=Serpula lacrymans var. lacrymans (strain S7.9) TaxID=578457 RepID=F8PDG6_SERL9|nr:uncharacterized protein SERLADRAFT_412027 [Serpula lacrymans var. lacrymans S7.9]EGO18787.1 hypothetical protein SERLADRAFT_412027 [Serpula lacrymans var. lacrymans S7.9]
MSTRKISKSLKSTSSHVRITLFRGGTASTSVAQLDKIRQEHIEAENKRFQNNVLGAKEQLGKAYLGTGINPQDTTMLFDDAESISCGGEEDNSDSDKTQIFGKFFQTFDCDPTIQGEWSWLSLVFHS